MTDAIFPPFLALRAMRSGAYANTATALAEIIDNSYEANAKDIHICLICPTGMAAPHTIAVLDNGDGMTYEELRRSIQFGYGKNLNTEGNKLKLGKFGVGLLSASVSQCKDLQVMSWRDSMDDFQARTVGFSIDENDNSIMNNILPRPDMVEVPADIQKALAGFSGGTLSNLKSGTLVIWRDCTPSWKKATTLIDHLSFECGRIYRNFIRNGNLRITITASDNDGNDIPSDSSHVPAVDPMFLHHWKDKKDTLANFKGHDTLFQVFTGTEDDDGKNQDDTFREHIMDIETLSGATGKVKILASHRRMGKVIEDARSHGHNNPGSAPYGKLADILRGVSILRHGREIMLDQKWLKTDLTIDRWIAVSVDFDPSLDELFGVSNNKQSAPRLSRLATISGNNQKDEQLDLDLYDQDEQQLYAIAQVIALRLSKMRKKIGREQPRKKQNGEPEQSHDPAKSPLEELVEITKAVEPRDELLPPKPSNSPAKDLKKAYGTHTYIDNVRADLTRPEIVIRDNLKFDLVADHAPAGSALFNSVYSGNTVLVRVNADHPLYGRLKYLLAKDIELGESINETPGQYEGDTPDSLADRLEDALAQLMEYQKTIRFMILSFARAEEEAKNKSSDQGAAFEDCRIAWGRVARDIFEHGRHDD